VARLAVYYLCGAIFTVGTLLYATGHGRVPWRRRPALAVVIMKDSVFENWKHIALIVALHVRGEEHDGQGDSGIGITPHL